MSMEKKENVDDMLFSTKSEIHKLSNEVILPEPKKSSKNKKSGSPDRRFKDNNKI